MAVTFIGAEATSPLAGNATFNGATRQIGDPLGTLGQASRLRAMAYSDVAGTLKIQQSRDGTTWRSSVVQPVAAGDPGQVVEALIVRPYVRVVYVNGATIQTVFELDLATAPI